MYDITNQQSLEHALEWKKHLDKVIIQQNGNYIPAVLIGNKVVSISSLLYAIIFRLTLQYDTVEQNKQVFEAPLAIWKRHEFIKFFATSVKTAYHVVDSVEFLVKKVKS